MTTELDKTRRPQTTRKNTTNKSMPLPKLLIQYQCTTPSCSRMSSPLNILHLLPSVEELMSGETTQIPFVTMRLKDSAEQLCPFCRSPSRIVPVDPSFQNPELRSALRAMFGSFFGPSGPDLLEAQHTQWVPVQAPGNDTTNTAQGTRVQWVTAGGQIHQLLIAASTLTGELQNTPTQTIAPSGSGSRPTALSARSISAPPVQNLGAATMHSPNIFGSINQNRLHPLFTPSIFQQLPQQPGSPAQSNESYSIFSPGSSYSFTQGLGQLNLPPSILRILDVSTPTTQTPHPWSEMPSRDESGGDNSSASWSQNWSRTGAGRQPDRNYRWSG